MSKNFNDFNLVQFSGNLAFAPRLASYQTRSGKTVKEAFFTVLSDDTYNGYTTDTPFQCIAFGKHAVNIAKSYNKGDLVRGKGKVNAYSTKKVQGVSLKYPVTVTRFNIYKMSLISAKSAKGNQQATTNNQQDTKQEPKATVGATNNNASSNTQDTAKGSTKIDENSLPF